MSIYRSIYLSIYLSICILSVTQRSPVWRVPRVLPHPGSTANLPTNIVDFRGFDSSTVLMLRGGIPRPIWGFPGKFDSSNVGRVQC